MKPRAIVIVLDSVGIGHAPDAAAYGDEGADTMGHILERHPELALPNLDALGLAAVRAALAGWDGPVSPSFPHGAATWMTEASAGKDTTTGHWELAGSITTEPFATFSQFPDDLVRELEESTGTRYLGNVAASGTTIIEKYGEEHLRTGFPILYTSADSVLQIAAHEERFGLERLWQACRTAREILDRRGLRVGRVIARPFVGEVSTGFRRTANRHDYSLLPPETVLDRLVATGVIVKGIGKISDIFAGKGVTESHPTTSNAHGMATLDALTADGADRPEFLFANLVDFDSQFGHRRDPSGYARALAEFDLWLGGFLKRLGGHDLLVITADHGNDPTWPGTDHTRERVPLLVVNSPAALVPDHNFTQVAELVARHFSLPSTR